MVDVMSMWHVGPMPLEMAGVAFQTGAAVAFGLMGMAEAIQEREAEKHWAAADASIDEAQGRHYEACHRERAGVIMLGHASPDRSKA